MMAVRRRSVLTTTVRARLTGLLYTPALDSMTLDADDVELARTWLRRRDGWEDRSLTMRFEAEFRAWNGSRHAFSFASARVALSACVYALDLRPGDEVILPGYTCVVVANAFRFAGVRPVFADIELETYGLDVRRVAEKITPCTRAILLHHLYGLVCRDYDALLELAATRGIRVVEDCAHATGAEYRGQKVGTRGQLAIYSSEQSKVFNTTEGGLAATNDDGLAARLAEYQQQAPEADPARTEAQLRTLILNYYRAKAPQSWWRARAAVLRHGRNRVVTTTPEEELGIRPAHYGRRMSAPIAALGLNQLAKVDAYNRLRRENAARWDRWCNEAGYAPPLAISGSTPVYLRYPVLVEPERKRDTSWAVTELGIRVGEWFVGHLHPVRERMPDCPAAGVAVDRCVNLPCLLRSR